jgi:hypothetical protein
MFVIVESTLMSPSRLWLSWKEVQTNTGHKLIAERSGSQFTFRNRERRLPPHNLKRLSLGLIAITPAELYYMVSAGEVRLCGVATS